MDLALAPLTFLDDGADSVRRNGDDIVIATPETRLRIRRDRLLACRPMLGRIHRGRNASHFPTEHDEDIVVELQMESEPTRWLGPFPHRRGLALGRAIDMARREALIAVPGFAITIAPDAAAMVVDCGGMSIPVPTAYLVALRTKTSMPAARHVLPTGIAADAANHYVEVVFASGPSWALGPLPLALATPLVVAFQAWRAHHPIDAEPVDVDMRELDANPTRWHRRRIRVVGWWSSGFERSSFGTVWLSASRPAAGNGDYRVRVAGTLTYPNTTAEGGYGHMGSSPGELEAESVEILDARPWSKTGARDGLTGLFTRAAWLPRVEEALAEGSARMAILDLDHFKRVNDTHGHLVGDDVLRAWAKLVADAVGARGVVGRWGGEEIAVLFAASTDLADAERIVASVAASIRALSVPAGAAVVTVTCSAGVTEGAKGEDAHEVFARCDEALYQAKASGRDRVVVRGATPSDRAPSGQ